MELATELGHFESCLCGWYTGSQGREVKNEKGVMKSHKRCQPCIQLHIRWRAELLLYSLIIRYYFIFHKIIQCTVFIQYSTLQGKTKKRELTH